MIRLGSFESWSHNKVTYELSDGRRIDVDRRMVETLGLVEVARVMGVAHLLPTGRLPVMQDGAQVGTVPATFEPLTIRSRCALYDPRPGDFRREGNTWVASSALGPGDLRAVPEFVWDPKI